MGTSTPYGLRIPPTGKTWVYDFRVNGQRYTKSTHKTRYDQALKLAARVHAEAEGVVSHTKVRRLPDMPLREVFGRYYNERAQGLASADNLLGQLNSLAEALGPDLFLSQLTLNDVLNYQTGLRKSGLANRTVNSYVVELLRPVIKQTRKWGINRGPLADLTGDDWAELKLPLPAHRSRSASRPETALLMSKVRKDYRPIVMFALLSGLRKSALLIKRNQIDWTNEVMWYPKKSKRTGDIGWLPLTKRMLRLLRHEIMKGGVDCEWVFTFNGQRNVHGYTKDTRYPITGSGFKGVMQLAVKNAKLPNWRLIHDLRHTAATELLRSSQNLAAVQMVLGHSDIAQTARYAHVLSSDARRAMETRR